MNTESNKTEDMSKKRKTKRKFGRFSPAIAKPMLSAVFFIQSNRTFVSSFRFREAKIFSDLFFT